jgi:hypothetical protein
MPFSSFRVFATAVFALVSTVVMHAAEPAIIAKARARLAPDAVLDAVKSIHYVGTMTGPDPQDATKERQYKIEIFLQKPAQQRIEIRSDQAIEVSALDDYDAWRRVTDVSDPNRWQQSQLPVDQIKQLRADVWQNLAFFRGIEQIGGTVEDQGPETIDGVSCRKIAFVHGPGLVYYRYFNEATGELVYTGDENNNIREQGEMMAGGIRFPKTLRITQRSESGTEVRTIVFEKITLNETFPRDLFAVPLPIQQ